MYSQAQLEEAFKVGVGAGLACGHAKLTCADAWRYLSPNMDRLLADIVCSELHDDDCVEVIK